MKKIISTFADHISFFRPLLLIPLWTPALLGFWSGGGKEGIKGQWEVLLLTTLLGISIYGLNQLFDEEGDRLNKKNLPIALGYVSRNMGKFIIFVAFLGALLEALSINLAITAITMVALLLGIAYSAPPWRFKDKAVLGLVSNAFGHGFLIYFLGYVVAFSLGKNAVWDWMVILRAASYALAYGAVYLFTTVPDTRGDSRVGKNTFAVKFGERKTMAIALLGIFLTGAFGLAIHENNLFLTAIVSLPFYLAAVAKKEITPRLIVRANKIAVLTLAILTCFYLQVFIMPVFVAIVFAILYNRLRLGVKYP